MQTLILEDMIWATLGWGAFWFHGVAMLCGSQDLKIKKEKNVKILKNQKKVRHIRLEIS